MPGLRSLIARRKCTTTIPVVDSELSHKFPISDDFDSDSSENGSDDKISTNFCLNNILSSNDIDDLKSKLNGDMCAEELSPISDSQLNENDLLLDEQKENEDKISVKMKLLHESVSNAQSNNAFYETSKTVYDMQRNICNGMKLDYLKTNVNLDNSILSEACHTDIKNKNNELKQENILERNNSPMSDSLCQQNCCDQSEHSETVNSLESNCSSVINGNDSNYAREKEKDNIPEPCCNQEKSIKVEESSASLNSHYLCEINPVITSACVMLSKNISNPNSSQLKCPNCLNAYNSKSKVTFSMCQNVIKFECSNCDWIVVRRACMSK